MRILCTFPGKYGDILWALPTIRALSRRVGEPIDLAVAADFGSICPLIGAQPYIAQCFSLLSWLTQDTAPISPRVPKVVLQAPEDYDAVFHLGYRAWPTRPLPYETLDCLNEACSKIPWKPTGDYLGLRWLQMLDEELALDEPWITIPPRSLLHDGIAIGFTDEYFELKFGLVQLIGLNMPPPAVPIIRAGSSPRWDTEGRVVGHKSWEESAAIIRDSAVFLGCCSALHVLAVAVGTQVVLMEPQPMRHHPIFYPLGQDGPQVTLVKGIDGMPTHDARHVRDTIHQVLTSRQEITNARHD